MPRVLGDGSYKYELMAIEYTDESGNQWIVRQKVEQTQVPAVSTTSATPGAPIPATSY